MDSNLRVVLTTALAPIAWGANYYVIRHTLPADSPLWGSALRALPAALVLLLVARRLPHGAWWWRSAVLGTLTVGGFFLLVYLAAQLLPSSVAASIMAASPLVLAGFAWLLASERPTARVLAGSLVGIVGVLLVVATGSGAVSGWGVVASASAMAMSSFGFVLAKRWADDTQVVATTAWQMLFGGLLLTVVAAFAEGRPPALDGDGVAGMAFVSLLGTALAFVVWYEGLRTLSAGTVGLVGLLNPVTGVLLGALAAGEHLTPWQLAGIALVLGGIVVGQQRSGRSPGGRSRSQEEELDSETALEPVGAGGRATVGP